VDLGLYNLKQRLCGGILVAEALEAKIMTQIILIQYDFIAFVRIANPDELRYAVGLYQDYKS